MKEKRTKKKKPVNNLRYIEKDRENNKAEKLNSKNL